MKLPLIAFMGLLGICFANEPVQFPLEVGTLKAGVRIYEGAKIVGSDAVGVKVSHEGGSARVRYEHLPEELRSKFSFNRDAAREQVRRENEAAQAYDRQIAEAELVVLQRKADNVDEFGRPRRSSMELYMDAQRAQELHNYIVYLRTNIIRTESEIQKRMLRAQQTQLRGIARGGSYYSRSGLRAASRAISAHIRTLPDREKIAIAKMHIQDAERQILALETQR